MPGAGGGRGGGDSEAINRRRTYNTMANKMTKIQEIIYKTQKMKVRATRTSIEIGCEIKAFVHYASTTRQFRFVKQYPVDIFYLQENQVVMVIQEMMVKTVSHIFTA